MSVIDSVGVYLGEILEHGVNLTKNGFPQVTLRLRADQKWIDDDTQFENFGLKEKGYGDWSSFDEEMIGFFVLFNSKDIFDESTKLLNYEQLQLATGWTGQSFDDLGNGSLVGKKLLFRVEEHTYNDKTSLQVSWIDAATASPERSLKNLDTSAISSLNSKLKIGKPTAKPAVPAKPGAVAPKKPSASSSPQAPAGSPASPPAPSGSASSAASPTTSPTTTSRSKPPKKAPTAAPAPVEEIGGESPATETLPSETTKDEAWAYVITNKGANEDTVVEDAWLAAAAQVGGSRQESEFTGKDWAAIRNAVKADLAL